MELLHHVADTADLTIGLLQFANSLLGGGQIARVQIGNIAGPAGQLFDRRCRFFAGVIDDLGIVFLLAGIDTGLLGNLAPLGGGQRYPDTVVAKVFQRSAQTLHKLVEQFRCLDTARITRFTHAQRQITLCLVHGSQHLQQFVGYRCAARAHQHTGQRQTQCRQCQHQPHRTTFKQHNT